MAERLLVTGASGHFGRRVLHHLLADLNVEPERVLATTRNPDSLSSWSTRGVDIRTSDFDDEASLHAAFLGADRLLLISTDADAPGRRIAQHRRAIAAAERAGVDHLIYTLMTNPADSFVLFAPDHSGSEDAIRESGIAGWTILRNHWYFENLLMLLPGVLSRGDLWFSAAGEGRSAEIARDDLAFAAAYELAGQVAGKCVYTLSGPEAMTVAEQAHLMSGAIGKQIQVIPVSADELIHSMAESGMPESFARLLASFDLNVAACRMAGISEDFERMTGRKPKTFAQWLDTNKNALSLI